MKHVCDTTKSQTRSSLVSVAHDSKPYVSEVAQWYHSLLTEVCCDRFITPHSCAESATLLAPFAFRSKTLTKHSFKNIMRRLSLAGFKKDFIRPAILPDWWDDSCVNDPSVLPDVEIRVARFLRRSIAEVRDPSTPLAAPTYEGAQLRRVRDIDRDRLAPAIHSALQIAGAVVRSLRESVPPATVPPSDAFALRQQINTLGRAPTLDDILGILWNCGIPVVPVDVLPTPSFQGLACIVEGRPVILLGHKHDEPGRVAFFVAHEAGHVAAGDCTPGQPVIDEDEDVADNSDMEFKADQYATRLLVGSDTIPQIDGTDFRQLAQQAAALERLTGAEASAIIFAWADKKGTSEDYAKASMAVKALYRSAGARRNLRQHFDRHVNLDSATESDRSLLRCVYGDPDHAVVD